MLPAPEGFFRVLIEAATMSIEDHQGTNASLNVFPNSAHAITWMPVTMEKSTTGAIMLYDLQGSSVQVIHKRIVHGGESKYFFDAAKVISGFYMLELQTAIHKICKPVVVR